MKIAIASDHAGYELKEYIKALLQDKGHEIHDFGTDDSDTSVDYPDHGRPAALSVAQGQNRRAVLVCGTGLGMSMTANRIPGIRGALCHNEYTAEMARKHNDANVLIMGGRILDQDQARKILDVWLETDFEGGRHQRRIELIDTVCGG